MTDNRIKFIRDHIGVFTDFPKKGIVFRDIFTALTNGQVCVAVKEILVEYVRNNHKDVDVIVGLEARGFLFCFTLAAELGVSCVPIRKKGKLAGPCISCDYELEYGVDSIEIQNGSIKPGQKVLIIDDLLATGGSLEASTKLIRQIGGSVLECIVLLELKSLLGRNRLDCKVHSFIAYD